MKKTKQNNDNKNVDSIIMLKSGKTKGRKDEFYCLKET